MVSFPDVAGANTSGNDRGEALEMAEDALSVVLAGYMKLRRSIPVPSAVVDGQETVAVNPVVAAKLELYSATRDQGITKRALAKRLGLSDTTVGGLNDPDHRSHISQVTRALRSIGRNLVIEGRADPVR
ncbi:MAG: type II toxin-antitoxin system HicB family antitoxin [Bryobacterales bacterium]|nr:type II toxin-antitoxin system HicB family antitoxin [Bryobacterales bacterium]